MNIKKVDSDACWAPLWHQTAVLVNGGFWGLTILKTLAWDTKNYPLVVRTLCPPGLGRTGIWAGISRDKFRGRENQNWTMFNQISLSLAPSGPSLMKGPFAPDVSRGCWIRRLVPRLYPQPWRLKWLSGVNSIRVRAKPTNDNEETNNCPSLKPRGEVSWNIDVK